MNRYNSLNDWLKKKFGQRVYKISLDAHVDCPNRDGVVGRDGCVFCNFESYRPATTNLQNVTARHARHDIKSQLQDGIEYVRKRHRADKFISYFQSGTNTYGELDDLHKKWLDAIDDPGVVALAISTRPDCISKRSLDILSSLSEKIFLWIELGLQSANDHTLLRINRGHDSESFINTNVQLRKAEIPVCAHVILGLPEETTDDFKTTANFLNKQMVWGVKIHNLHILKNTRMENEYNDGKIKIPTLAEYAVWTREFIEQLSPEIIIHRFNSHSPRELTVAPSWSINKMGTLNAIEAELKKADSFQGKNFPTDAPIFDKSS